MLNIFFENLFNLNTEIKFKRSKKTACKYIIITHHRLRLLTHCKWKWKCKQAQMYWQSF